MKGLSCATFGKSSSVCGILVWSILTPQIWSILGKQQPCHFWCWWKLSLCDYGSSLGLMCSEMSHSQNMFPVFLACSFLEELSLGSSLTLLAGCWWWDFCLHSIHIKWSALLVCETSRGKEWVEYLWVRCLWQALSSCGIWKTRDSSSILTSLADFEVS